MTDDNKQVLIKILQDVFTEEELKTICENHTSKLKGNPYDAITGNTVNARYSSLVNHLIKKGLIDSFLEILCKSSKHFADLVKSLRSEVTVTPKTTIQNANNIVNYIFVIVTPHPTVNKKYIITSQVAQFENNDTKMNTPDSETIITLSNIDQGYSENQIISVAINEIINQLKSKPNIFTPTPIIELFLPHKLLTKDFSIKKIKEAGIDQPIGHLYPFTVRSYNRFTDQASKGRLESKFQKLKKIIADTNDINNLQEYCHLITKNDLQLKPDRFYINYISPGTPLCLWIRCSLEEDNRTIDDVYQEIFNISNNNFCKVDKIYEQLLSIRQQYYRKHEERLIVGVLFDHDKLPTQISQLTSPNMSMNTA